MREECNLEKEWDVFISHASEDKDTIVRELAKILEALSLKVWYDESTLKVGDSLSKSIDEGLMKSKYGIVIISENFLKKQWTDYEYRSLITKEVNGNKVILPLWHNITYSQIREYSLFLADKLALDTSKLPLNVIALKLLQVINPELFKNIYRHLQYKKMLANAEKKTVHRSEIKFQTEPQSKLSEQQVLRVKALLLGINKHFDKSLEETIYNLELDLHPEREIQCFEVMNVCYLEYIKKYQIEDDVLKKEIATVLLGFSLGDLFEVTHLSEENYNELYELWKENFVKY